MPDYLIQYGDKLTALIGQFQLIQFNSKIITVLEATDKCQTEGDLNELLDTVFFEAIEACFNKHEQENIDLSLFFFPTADRLIGIHVEAQNLRLSLEERGILSFEQLHAFATQHGCVVMQGLRKAVTSNRGDWHLVYRCSLDGLNTLVRSINRIAREKAERQQTIH